jgi:hypothetical protein
MVTPTECFEREAGVSSAFVQRNQDPKSSSGERAPRCGDKTFAHRFRDGQDVRASGARSATRKTVSAP